jgi:hypothetical protein
MMNSFRPFVPTRVTPRQSQIRYQLSAIRYQLLKNFLKLRTEHIPRCH